MRMNWLVLMILVVGGVSCAHRREERRPAGPPPGAVSHAGWVELGSRSVDGARDRDVIPVGAREGRYRRIMLVVEKSALEMFDVVVTFGDGSRFSPPTRHVFGPNTRSKVIDLPGDARVIRSVEFKYGNLPGGGRAQLELWAE